jgi:hypothetical protein
MAESVMRLVLRYHRGLTHYLLELSYERV